MEQRQRLRVTRVRRVGLAPVVDPLDGRAVRGQGTLPHDLIHYVVESTLPLKFGFLSLVARGADALFVMETVHDRTNPSVETEAVQAEAVVEALQTQLWSGEFDTDAFLEGARLATAARGKPTFDFAAIDPRILYGRALDLLERWQRVPFHRSLELEFAGSA